MPGDVGTDVIAGHSDSRRLPPEWHQALLRQGRVVEGIPVVALSGQLAPPVTQRPRLVERVQGHRSAGGARSLASWSASVVLPAPSDPSMPTRTRSRVRDSSCTAAAMSDAGSMPSACQNRHGRLAASVTARGPGPRGELGPRRASPTARSGQAWRVAWLSERASMGTWLLPDRYR